MRMILVGLGANLTTTYLGPPVCACERALTMLAGAGAVIAARSRWYRSRPVPASAQPWFVNGVVRLESDLAPRELLALLHEVEAALGRVRRQVNEARIIDLDLLAHGDTVCGTGPAPLLPHPRMHERAFVLHPLRDIAPDWRHPVLGAGVGALLAALPAGQEIMPLAN